MYALASLGLRRSAGGFCVAGAELGALQVVGCTAWRPLVSAALQVAFAWQVWDNVHCQRLGCTPLHGRRGTMCTAKDSDVRPGGLCLA